MEISLLEWLSGILLGFTLLFVGARILVQWLASARQKPTGDKYLAGVQLRTLARPPVEDWNENVQPQSLPMRIDPFRRFPQYATITIDVVFPGEYRIGWKYENHEAVPGAPRYFEFWEAAEYASNWFAESFPDAARKAE